MKKSTRISLLVFTICAAIFAFGALWYTRPSTPSYIIEEAKQRQGVPLLEVEDPATRLPPPEINYDVLAEKVSPQIKTSLMNDESFVSSIVASNKNEIATAVQNYTDEKLVPTLEDKISSLIKDLSDSLTARLKADLTTMVDDKIQTNLNNIDINTYLPQLVDALTPIVVNDIYSEIEANKEDFVQTVTVQSPQLTDTTAEQLYNDYRTQIINDLVPIILDNIEATIVANNVDSSLSSTSQPAVEATVAPFSRTMESPVVDDEPVPTVIENSDTFEDTSSNVEPVATIEEPAAPVEEPVAPVEEPAVTNIVDTTPTAPKAPEVKALVATPTTTVDTTETPIVEDTTTKSDTESINVVAQVPEQETIVDSTSSDATDSEISIPNFDSSQTQVLTAEDYAKLRDAIREQAIQDALNKLSE
ncbi:MAG: hypothetical protein ACPKOI_03250 [Pleomorphochaeta sp.]